MAAAGRKPRSKPAFRHCLGEFQLLPTGGREVSFHMTGPPQGGELTAATLSLTEKRAKTPEDEGQKIKDQSPLEVLSSPAGQFCIFHSLI